MEIIMENYLWFAVAGVILLMAFIGYIAEKTDFGRKEFEKKVRPVKEPKVKKEKIKKQKEVQEIVEVIEETPAEEISMPVEEITEVFAEENIEEDLTVPLSDDTWGETITAEEPVEDIVMDSPINEEVNDYNQPIEEVSFSNESIEEPIVEELTSSEEPIVEELTSSEEPVIEEIVSFEEPTIENTLETEDNSIEETKVELENLELPSIDSLKEEESDDDVWKF